MIVRDEIKKLINEDKFKEAFELFKSHLTDQSFTPDSGEIYAMLSEAFIDATNSINTEDSEDLGNIKNILVEINKKEKGIQKEIAIEKIKKEISEHTSTDS